MNPLRTAAIACAFALAPAAQAQNVSDLMPAEAPPPQGSPSAAQRLYPLPGQTAPAPGEAGAPGAAQGPSNKGRGEAVLESEDLSSDFTRGEGNVRFEGAVPPEHVVKKGDTLWWISDFYFRNPWYWPKLWAYNPIITNPHWIYPGDLLRLYPPGQNAPEMPKPQVGKQPETPRISVARSGAPSGILLRQNGFVEKGELDAAGTIVGSKEEKIMLSTLDDAYVKFGADKPLKTGDRYTIYRVVSDVKDPQSGKKLGSIVEIMGEVEVHSLTPAHIAKSTIVDAVNPVERGDRVGPLRRQFKLVEPSPNRTNIDGQVVAALRPTKIVGSEMLVFLDRGRADGVEVGNRFLVVRRGDGYAPLLADQQQDDKRYPREVIGEVLVVDVKERTATGVVTRAIKEVRMGDRVEARKGY